MLPPQPKGNEKYEESHEPPQYGHEIQSKDHLRIDKSLHPQRLACGTGTVAGPGMPRSITGLARTGRFKIMRTDACIMTACAGNMGFVGASFVPGFPIPSQIGYRQYGAGAWYATIAPATIHTGLI